MADLEERALDPEVRAELERDLAKTQANIRQLEKAYSGGVTPPVTEMNHLVVSPDYVSSGGPTLGKRNVPLEHPEGEYRFYQKIEQALEHALEHGFLRRDQLPERAPDYLRDLVRE